MFGTAFLFSILMVAEYGINGEEVNPTYNVCAKENSYCGCAGVIHYGVNRAWVSSSVETAGSMCKHSTLNLVDPAKGKYKYCICDPENIGHFFDLEFCAKEGEYCSCDQGLVWYGFHSSWTHNREMGSATCSRALTDNNVPWGPTRACVCVSETA